MSKQKGKYSMYVSATALAKMLLCEANAVCKPELGEKNELNAKMGNLVHEEFEQRIKEKRGQFKDK